MPTFEIKMPKLGESITEGTIVSWSVKVGDNIKEDEILFEVTTAKVNAEIPSPVDGTILEIDQKHVNYLLWSNRTFPEYGVPVESLKRPDGTGDSIVAAHSLIPEAMRHMMSGLAALLQPHLPLTRRQHEMIATVVSARNRCFY